MTEAEAAFRRAIDDEPDDNDLRLVYADWLDEQGDPRGELIRMQVVLTGMPGTSPEREALARRHDEYLQTHWDGLTRELGSFDRERVHVEFVRGVIISIRFNMAEPDDFAVLQRIPNLRAMVLQDCGNLDAVLPMIAAMQQLDALTIEGSPLDEDRLRILAGLPCWTFTRFYNCGYDGGMFLPLQAERMGRFRELEPVAQRRAALRFLRVIGGNPSPKSIHLYRMSISDAELDLLCAIDDIESIVISESDDVARANPSYVTRDGVRHLSRLPCLKHVQLLSTNVDDLRPLMNCATLESLEVSSEYGIAIGDGGTAGLERLTQLRELSLKSEGIGAETVQRLEPLRELRKLHLDLEPLEDLDCLAVLAGLRHLTHLTLNGPELSDSICQHLSELRDLEMLTLRIESGLGDGFRNLRNLQKLQQCVLYGQGIHDQALAHLAPLHGLRSIMAQHSAVTLAGARALADQLPNLTVILDEEVIKSPRRSMTFRRHALPNGASIVLPTNWQRDYRSRGDRDLWVREDGWEQLEVWSGSAVGAATIRCYPSYSGSTPHEAMMRCVNDNDPFDPQILEENPIALPEEGDYCSCIFANGFSHHLVFATRVGDQILVLDAEARGRFASFRRMFEYIAQSIRVGAVDGDAMYEVSTTEW